MKFSERIKSSGSSKSDDNDAYLVTNADKKANTPAWKGYLAGMKSKITGKPMYKAADHLKESWENPLDSMPIANGSNRYAPPERLAELEAELAKKKKKEWIEENPRPEEKMADWFKVEKPDESDEIEEEKTIHQKMYEMATARYNPFSIGGSENHSDISYNIGGSESIRSQS